MSKLPDTLEETVLWNLYLKKIPEQDSKRRMWVKDVYEFAVEFLKRVGDAFRNYTLHDERHVLNVIYAMGAILGDQASNLSAGEIELLILVAALHDIGMVYDDNNEEKAFNNERKCSRFLQENCPELIGLPYTEWPENTRQWYLRWLHPFRVSEVLETDEWEVLFGENCPKDVVPLQHIVNVCKSHGEDILSKNTQELPKYQPAYETDLLFCAILLRLADLLDFDNTRAPKILFKYAAGNEASRKEWRKHMASGGFTYPETPSSDDLIFSAVCHDPELEYSIRDFLDVIDDELINCNKLQKFCENNWQRDFPFPRSISKKNIESSGYVSEKFMITMEQDRILELLTGKNLYGSNDVFLRELLQNSVDAVLLRGKMDKNFKVEDARIDLWEWSDKDGSIWFRIDDLGTGMTMRMMKNYFLRVGNSYYNSKELKRDLSKHSSEKDFYSISRFGIGFLSCFLCGIEAEVSTLYFDDNKSRNECGSGSGDINGYGLRMKITGLSGYYTLKSQADDHKINELLPSPELMDEINYKRPEYDGFRSKPGTSIVIKLDPGKLGAVNLKASVKKYIYGTRMPVFYNGEKLGYTYSEIMEEAHRLSAVGETVFELSDSEKEEFDKTFPNIKGRYPKIVLKADPFDNDEYPKISGLSGFCLKYEARIDDSATWKYKDQTYTVDAEFTIKNGSRQIRLTTINRKAKEIHSYFSRATFSLLSKMYGQETLDSLKRALSKFDECPISGDELGGAWLPFAGKESISNVWVALVDESQAKKQMVIVFNDRSNEILDTRHTYVSCLYQGVLAGGFWDHSSVSDISAAFFLENDLQPITDIGRTGISALPLKAAIAIWGITEYSDLCHSVEFNLYILKNLSGITLYEWRRFFDSDLGKWIHHTQNKKFIMQKEYLISLAPNNSRDFSESGFNLESLDRDLMNNKIYFKILAIYFQLTYDMKIYYEKGQSFEFTEKKNTQYDDFFDKFPPMMFCYAGSEKSRRYLCCRSSKGRSAITLDHPFTQWLVKNATRLEKCFPRQFQQIVYSLCNCAAEEIIEIFEDFRQQIINLRVGGFNITSLPELTMNDFWDLD